VYGSPTVLDGSLRDAPVTGEGASFDSRCSALVLSSVFPSLRTIGAGGEKLTNIEAEDVRLKPLPNPAPEAGVGTRSRPKRAILGPFMVTVGAAPNEAL